jgi:hypothetical protein
MIGLLTLISKTPIGRFNPALYRVERDVLHLVLASINATQLFVGRKQAERVLIDAATLFCSANGLV